MKPKKRVNADGSEVWVVRWREAGRGSTNRSKTFASYRDAERFDIARKRARDLGQLASEVVGSQQTFEAFVLEWWKRYALAYLSPGTRATYKYVLSRWLVPYLGELRLRDLTREAVDTYVASAIAAGAGRPTVNRSLGILQGIMRRAVEWRRVPANPVAGVSRLGHVRSASIEAKTPEQVEEIRRKLRERHGGAIPSATDDLADRKGRDGVLHEDGERVEVNRAGDRPADASHFVESADSAVALSRVDIGRDHKVETADDRIHRQMLNAALVSVLAYEGLRPSEAVALDWADVLDSAGKPRARLRVRGTKSKRAVREPELFPPVARELAELYLGRGRPALDTPVFVGARGGRLDFRAWRGGTKKNPKTGELEKWGPWALVADFRPYDLRHTAATLLIYEGRPPQEVAAFLGHADPGFTLRTYTHIYDDALARRHVAVADAITAARREVRSAAR